MRKVLINAGFGSPLSEEDRAWIRGRGFHGVRSDYGSGVLGALFYTQFLPLIIAAERERSHEYIVDRVTRICREMKSLGYLHHRPYPIPAIEPINEPDLDAYWKTRPAEMSNLVWECYQIASRYSAGITVIVPGISNLTQDGLAYLDAMVSAGIPDEVAIGFHRYAKHADPTEAHDGFENRWAEVTRLLSIAGKRKLWCTETGWSSGPLQKRRGFPLCALKKKFWLSDQKVADFATTELRFWARVPNMETLVWYQINCGPNRHNPEDNFGLRNYPERADKVLAQMMPKLIEEVTNEQT